jgi:hypothetical protein
MPTPEITLLNQSSNGARHPMPRQTVDFCVDTLGPLVLFLPASPDAHVWAETGGMGAACKWLGVYLMEADAADTAISRMLEADLRVRVDGRTIET